MRDPVVWNERYIRLGKVPNPYTVIPDPDRESSVLERTVHTLKQGAAFKRHWVLIFMRMTRIKPNPNTVISHLMRDPASLGERYVRIVKAPTPRHRLIRQNKLS